MLLARLTLLTALALVLSAPSASALSAKVSVSLTDTSAVVTAVVTKASKTPARASVKFGKTSVTLKKASGNAARSTWRSSKITGARRNKIAAASTARVSVKLRVAGKNRTVTVRSRRSEPAGKPTPTPGTPSPGTPSPGTPSPGTPSPGTPAPASLFGTPAAPLVGQPAADALLPYLVDSRFTNCVAGWPNCAVEQRYGIFGNGDHWYCRLTNTSGADINSYGSNLQVTGASQETSGAWALSYSVLTYGNTVNYRWDVSPTGAATGYYWGAGVDTSDQPSEVISGMQWVRGARNCSY